MQIGNLNRRIDIYTQTTTADTYGATVETDSLVRSTWAQIEPASGNEALEGKKDTATRAVKFMIRYRTGMTEKMKIKYDGSFYNITAIEEPDKKRTLVITAEKKY